MFRFIKLGIAMLVLATGVQAANPGLSISWVCSVNCTDNTETAILIQQSPAGGTNWSFLASVAPTVTNYSITGLADLTTYCFRVAAYNAYGTGSWSNVACKPTVGPPSKIFQVTELDPSLSYWFRVQALGPAGVRESLIVMIDPRRSKETL